MSASDSSTPYTAIVHFHGMGNQRRYEESAGLVEAIDTYLRGSGQGELTEIEPRSERHRNDAGRTITYIRTRYQPPAREDGGSPGEREVRFYEVYWAPIMANPSGSWTIFWWILRQAGRPLTSLVMPWSKQKRLRRSRLALLWEDFQKNRARRRWTGYAETDFDTLLEAFTDFGEEPAYDEARLAGFCAYLTERLADDPEAAARAVKLAHRWRSRDRSEELSHLAVMLTILLAIALIASLIAWSLIQFVGWASAGGLIPDALQGPVMSWFGLIPGQKLGWWPALGLAGSLTVGGVLKGFLRNRMGDVEAWATYEETDEKHRKRAQVIEKGKDVLRHVMQKSDAPESEAPADLCERVVVVSHSLGTCVAQDTILALMRDNRAAPGDQGDPIDAFIRFDKLSHFITAGSPIDKVNYFFESKRDSGFQHRRIVDHLRGDISTEPFTRNRKPHTHWVNFWDPADIIGGALQSPTGKDDIANQVDNLRVANMKAPDPATAHNGYWQNRLVVERLFAMAYLDRYDFRHTEETLLHDARGNVTGQTFLPLMLGDTAQLLEKRDDPLNPRERKLFRRATRLTQLAHAITLLAVWLYAGVLLADLLSDAPWIESLFKGMNAAMLSLVALAILGVLLATLRRLLGGRRGSYLFPLNPDARG